jgi:hypothetical protein
MEVKWARNSKPDIEKDLEKLIAYRQHEGTSRAFLCIFGRKSHIEAIQIAETELTERGNPVFADFGKTKFGCRIYELAKPIKAG